MKKIIQFLFCLFLINLAMPSKAQESELKRGSVLPGYVITLNGDTLKGYLLNINLWLNQHMTFFYKDSADAKSRIKYKPNEIKAYQVGSRFYESMKYPFSYSTSKQNFILRKQHGPIDYYVWYFDEDKAKLMSPNISLANLTSAFLFNEKDLWKNEYGRKANGEFTEFGAMKFIFKFAKNMAAYVVDDAELAKKILQNTKGYQNIDVEKIIKEYNERQELIK